VEGALFRHEAKAKGGDLTERGFKVFGEGKSIPSSVHPLGEGGLSRVRGWAWRSGRLKIPAAGLDKVVRAEGRDTEIIPFSLCEGHARTLPF
jgi:hypothetical protein